MKVRDSNSQLNQMRWYKSGTKLPPFRINKNRKDKQVTPNGNVHFCYGFGVSRKNYWGYKSREYVQYPLLECGVMLTLENGFNCIYHT